MIKQQAVMIFLAFRSTLTDYLFGTYFSNSFWYISNVIFSEYRHTFDSPSNFLGALAIRMPNELDWVLISAVTLLSA